MDNNLDLQKAIASLRLVVGLGLHRDFYVFSLTLEVLKRFFRGGTSRKEKSKESWSLDLLRRATNNKRKPVDSSY